MTNELMTTEQAPVTMVAVDDTDDLCVTVRYERTGMVKARAIWARAAAARRASLEGR